MAGIHQQGWIVMGMLDDDPAKQGARIAGVGETVEIQIYLRDGALADRFVCPAARPSGDDKD